MQRLKQTGIILAFILGTELAGIIGSIFTVDSIPTWYVTLVTPAWNPPSWIFGPVWTILFALMGIAAYLVWRKRTHNKGTRSSLVFYGIQLIFNTLWSIIFFGLKNPGLAFADIIILLLMIVVTTVKFWKIDRYAGILFLPYLLWVSFATVLNFAIWQMN